jgi:hypothetical protein
MTPRRVRIGDHGKATPTRAALQVSRRPTADNRPWLIFQRLMCRRTFEVRLGDRGEHLCRG